MKYRITKQSNHITYFIEKNGWFWNPILWVGWWNVYMTDTNGNAVIAGFTSREEAVAHMNKLIRGEVIDPGKLGTSSTYTTEIIYPTETKG